MKKKTLKLQILDELSKEDKEDVEDLEKKKKIFKTLMKMHFQRNITWYTLTNIMLIDEKTNEAQKDDVNIEKYKNVNCPNQFHCNICGVHIIVCLFCIGQIRW